MNRKDIFDFNVPHKIKDFPEEYYHFNVGTLLFTLVYTPNRKDPLLQKVVDWDIPIAINPFYRGCRAHNDINKRYGVTIGPGDVIGYYSCEAKWIVLDDESAIRIPNGVNVHKLKLYVLNNNPPLNYLFFSAYLEQLKNVPTLKQPKDLKQLSAKAIVKFIPKGELNPKDEIKQYLKCQLPLALLDYLKMVYLFYYY